MQPNVVQDTPREHSAILSTFINLPFVIKIFVLSIFEWPFYIVFTVLRNRLLKCEDKHKYKKYPKWNSNLEIMLIFRWRKRNSSFNENANKNLHIFNPNSEKSIKQRYSILYNKIYTCFRDNKPHELLIHFFFFKLISRDVSRRHFCMTDSQTESQRKYEQSIIHDSQGCQRGFIPLENCFIRKSDNMSSTNVRLSKGNVEQTPVTS